MPSPANTTVFQYKDFFGHDIKAGDFIVYALSSQHHAFIKFGKVLALSSSKPSWGNPEPTIKVQGVERTWSGVVQKVHRVSTVTHLDKVVVLPVNVPQEFLSLV